jgi:hypothetical protein
LCSSVSMSVSSSSLSSSSSSSSKVHLWAIRPHASTSVVVPLRARGNARSSARSSPSQKKRTCKPSSGSTTEWLMGPGTRLPSSSVVRPSRGRGRGHGCGCGCGCNCGRRSRR